MKILYNPFAVLGARRGFVGALLVLLTLAGVARWAGVHLDPILVYVNEQPILPRVVAIESLIAWLGLGVAFFAAAKIFGGSDGLGACLAAAGLGRFPFIIAAVIMSRHLLRDAMLRAVMPAGNAVVVRPQDLITPGVIAGALALYAILAWAIVVLYLGFKEAAKLSGGKAVAAFVTSLVFAEVIGKLCLRLFKVG